MLSEDVDVFIPDQEEFGKAAKRLTANAATYGGEEPAALAWFLDFLQARVEGFSAGQRDDKMWEILRFIADGGQAQKNYGQSPALYFQPPDTPENKMAALDVLQAHAIEVVQRYLTTGVADFPIGEGAFKIARGYHSIIFGARSLTAGFYFMAAKLMARYGERVKICKGCRRLMLVGRKDKRYHSESCRISDFVRRKRANAKVERLARQHKARGKRRRKHGKER
jgi:hypothetical protein